jgi:O-antigen biosynthesis protein
MLMSLFTPTHDPRFLRRLAESVARQSYRPFEWIIVTNGAARPADLPELPPQARVLPFPGQTGRIGALKAFCCAEARGAVLVEVDHDDELTPDALEALADAFGRDPALSFAYSNCCEIKDGKPWKYNECFGWEYRPFRWQGGDYFETCTFDPSPASFSKIWYAPNHVRAWRTDFYRRIGGHDPNLAVLDDHDLLARTYLHGKVAKIDRCLYVYHLHGDNTCQGEQNTRIQADTLALHDKYLEALVGRWCDLHGLLKIDLAQVGLERLAGHWPWADGAAGLLIARDLLCKLPEPARVMAEAYRCLAPNGWFLTDTPSTDGRGAFQDPRHVSYWNANSFWYYTRDPHAGFIGTPVRFQLNRVKDYYPSAWHEQNRMSYVRADLVKFAGRVPGVIDFRERAAAPLPAAALRPPVFTIITPTIERASLARCCRSVAEQTYPHWQHLVLVDGPAWTIPTEPLAHPNRVFLVSGERHHDFGNAARHGAYAHVRGDYILGLDDDNYLLHDRALETLSRSLAGADWAVFPMVRAGRYFFADPPGRKRTDLAQMVYRPIIRGQPIRYPCVPDYDADGILCEALKALAPPRMLAEVGPLVMYEKANRGSAAPDP